MTQYIYSISINKQNETIRFLKSFDTPIKVENKIVEKVNEVEVAVMGDETETYTLVEVCEKETFEEMYEEWKRLTRLYKLSMEYVKDEWVYVLAYKQLHSGVDRIYNQKITHNDIPRLRPKNKREEDLRLRKAESRDYGSREESKNNESEKAKSIKDLMKKKEWLGRWYWRFLHLTHDYLDCVCGQVDYYTAKDLFLQSFILTIADIHESRGDEIPEKVNHLTIQPAVEMRTVPIITTIGVTVLENLSQQQYEWYIAPTLEGRARELAPNNYFYSREDSKELYEIYWETIPFYSELYFIP